MAKLHTDILLRMIAQGGDVGPLIKAGLHYSQIAAVISSTLEAGFLEVRADGEFELNDLGYERLARARFQHMGHDIRPLEEARRPRREITAVYLPTHPPKSHHE